MSQTRWSFVLAAAVALGGCQMNTPSQSRPSQASAVSEKPDPFSVYVVNYPLKYFAERLGGEHVEVVFPAPAEIDPAYWSPVAETVAAYQGADLILRHGAGYAKWIERVSLPTSRLVDTSAAFAQRYLPLEEATVHSHGPEGEHSHQGTSFVTWLDPDLAIEHARSVTAALTKAKPKQSEAFQQAFQALEADWRAFDARLAAVAESLGSEPLIFSHPVYQYFERRYGLNGRSVYFEPEESPDEGMWRELGHLLRAHPARWMIWEGVPLPATARRLESMGLRSVVYAPCANVPAEGDLLSMMRRNVAGLEAALSAAPST